MTVASLLSSIRPANADAAQRARRRWDSISKPLGSLGLLEDAIVRIAGASGTERVDVSRRCVVVLCADNGVVAEGVTQCGCEVTAAVAGGIARGTGCVSRMAKVANAEVLAVDMGMCAPLDEPNLLSRRVGPGTRNLAREPAMTRAQAEQALLTGAALAADLAAQGHRLLLTGEMGIGNTTTSSAVTALLLGRAPAEVTGRGAGLSSEGLSRKIAAIEQGIALHRPDPADALDVLAKVGGFDLAGLAGVFLGGAAAGVPVVIDGFISAAAALAAVRLCPDALGYLLASHASAEPGADLALAALGLVPPIRAGLRLGEGTGAVTLLPLLDLALCIYTGMSTFAEVDIENYVPLV